MSDKKDSNGPHTNTIGIDLGTTFCCMGKYQNGRVDIIPNDQGARTMPSVISFANNERLIGDVAVEQLTRCPELTVFDCKRMIGRFFDDKEVQENIPLWPFKVASKNNCPVICVRYMDEEKQFAPQELSGMILEKLKNDAEKYLGKVVDSVVITVPAYFSDAQRQATKDAGVIAGMNVLRIINEPTAAAMAYGMDNKDIKDETVLVYDLGGGTFDSSVLCIDEGIFEVKGTKGDMNLGGRDFDNALVTKWVEEFKQKHGKDITSNRRAIAKLRQHAEKVKRGLSGSFQQHVAVDSLFEGIDFNSTVTRARFNQIIDPWLDKTIVILKELLSECKLDKKDIKTCVCVGGSTRIPRVIEKLEQFFGKKPSCSINPDEAIAYGAAVQAAVLQGDDSKEIKDILLLDVMGLPVGIRTQGDIMQVILERNTSIPNSNSQIFTTTVDGQTNVQIEIFQGERVYCKDNTRIGVFELNGIKSAKRGVPQIEVAFTVDVNGVLNVTAQEKGTEGGAKANVTISKSAYARPPEEIQRTIAEAEKFREHDAMCRARAGARNTLETFYHSCQERYDQEKSKFTPEQQRACEKELEHSRNLLNKENNALTKEELETAYNTLSKAFANVGGDSGSMPPQEPSHGGPIVEEVD